MCIFWNTEYIPQIKYSQIFSKIRIFLINTNYYVSDVFILYIIIFQSLFYHLLKPKLAAVMRTTDLTNIKILLIWLMWIHIWYLASVCSFFFFIDTIYGQNFLLIGIIKSVRLSKHTSVAKEQEEWLWKGRSAINTPFQNWNAIVQVLF